MHDHAGSTVAFHTTMPFMGYEVVGSIEGHPVKNHLPPELGVLFKTRRQWEDLGVRVRSGSGVPMHPTMMSYRTYVYYHIDDTEARTLTGEARREFDGIQSRLEADLREATGHGGLKALYESRKSESYRKTQSCAISETLSGHRGVD